MYTICDVLDLEMYDKNGKFITEFKSLKYVFLNSHPQSHVYLHIQDALFNLKISELLLENEDNEHLSDPEKAIKESNETIFNFNGEAEGVPVKLIGRGKIKNAQNGEDSHEFKLIVPNAVLIQDFNLNLNGDDPHFPTYKFKILPYKDKKDLF